jgi:hypothetical protein
MSLIVATSIAGVVGLVISEVHRHIKKRRHGDEVSNGLTMPAMFAVAMMLVWPIVRMFPGILPADADPVDAYENAWSDYQTGKTTTGPVTPIPATAPPATKTSSGSSNVPFVVVVEVLAGGPFLHVRPHARRGEGGGQQRHRCAGESRPPQDRFEERRLVGVVGVHLVEHEMLGRQRRQTQREVALR